MLDRAYRSWFGYSSHLTPEQLIAYVDGELSQRAAQRTRKHLDRCWICRAECDRIGRAISGYMQHRRSAGWDEPTRIPDFEDRLRRYAAGLPCPKRFAGPWLHWLIAPSAVGIAAAVLLVLPHSRVQTVSAKELLERSKQAERGREAAPNAPIVYQKVAVRRTARSGANAALLLEIWDHPARQSYRRNVQNYDDCPLDVGELERLLASNGMNPKRPLSAEGFTRWRDSAPGAEDEVSQTTGPKSSPALLLRTKTSERRDGRIAQAELLLDGESWRPVFEKLVVLRSGDTEVYEITELEYHVTHPNSAELEIGPPRATTALPLQADPAPVAAFETPLATEIQVLYALHRIGVCLGEPVHVVARDGIVRLEGLVDSLERKNQIVAAVASMEGASAITIDVRTIAEAQLAAIPALLEETPAMHVEPDGFPLRHQIERSLGTRFSAFGFSAAAVAASNQLMSHAWALRHLAERFGRKSLTGVSVQTQWLLESMIHDHVDALQSGLAELRRTLEPLAAHPATAPETVQPRTDWVEEALILFRNIEAAHSAILQAFAGSGEQPAATIDSIVVRIATAEHQPTTLKKAVLDAFLDRSSAAANRSTEPPPWRDQR